MVQFPLTDEPRSHARMLKQLTLHFWLHEFLPDEGAPDPLPAEVLENLEHLAQLLELALAIVGLPLYLTSGLRLRDHNLGVGGVRGSDHLEGRAADFQVDPVQQGWQGMTIDAFHLLVKNLSADAYGQMILEDRRQALKNDAKLCIHLSLPSPKHPGGDDPDRLLVSYEPRVYMRWQEVAA